MRSRVNPASHSKFSVLDLVMNSRNITTKKVFINIEFIMNILTILNDSKNR